MTSLSMRNLLTHMMRQADNRRQMRGREKKQVLPNPLAPTAREIVDEKRRVDAITGADRAQ